MGEVEQAAGVKIRRRRIQDALLTTLYGVVGMTLVLATPNAAQLLRHFDPDVHKKRKPAYRLQQAMARLEEKGLVRKKKGKGGRWRCALTEKGRRKASALYEAQRVVVRKPRKWDGRWRIIAFDIWEKRRGARDKLRQALDRAGFMRVQNSVWACPYDCEELVELLRTDLRLGKSVLYIVAEGVENDRWLRKHFGLPLS